jgi:Domain of unknown function (DUF222)
VRRALLVVYHRERSSSRDIWQTYAAERRFLTTPGWRSRRWHDGENSGLRGLLASGDLGQHNGLPASIIVTTTLKDLETAAGAGLTGGGTILPMSDVIRLARHANHYLAIFGKGKALALYHTKRLASPAQRIVLCVGAVGGSVGAPYRIVQMGTWPGAYSLPAQGVPQMCKCA